jgi:hypothetical protein
MHQSLVKFSESEASNHTPSLADFTTTTPELKFSVHTGIFAICCDLTRHTITRLARTFGQQGRAVAANSTCRWSHFAYAISRRTSSTVCASLISDRHNMPLVAFCLRHFLADSIICMCVFDFRQAQPC